MKCIACDNKKDLKKQKITAKYTQCGLDNVSLVGVDYLKCDQCGEEYFGFGDQEHLHSLIAKVLIKKDRPLIGKEFRFLRTYLGFSGRMLAKLIGYEPEHISRIENDKSKISSRLDVLMRSLVVNKLPDRDYDFHDWLLDEGKKSIQRIKIQSDKGQWKLAA